VSGALIVVLIVVAVIVIAVVGFIVSYNKFARQRNTIEESWRQIDVELQRRHDLIGNLVEVTKAAAKFEQATLVQITQARAQAMAEQALNGALANFFQVVEAYPDLKTSQDFLYLQEQLVECEDRVAAGRRFYNGNVRAFNTRFDTFPSSIVANFGKFEKKEYYEVDDPQVRAAPSLRGLGDQITPTPPIGSPAPPQIQPPQG
jgi:LemA protein